MTATRQTARTMNRDEWRRTWSDLLDEWIDHQHKAHPDDEHAYCNRCLALVRLLGDIAADLSVIHNPRHGDAGGPARTRVTATP